MASQSAMGAGTVAASERGGFSEAGTVPVCPACTETTRDDAVEQNGKYKLFGCGACGLQFWEPREMPDAGWYEQMYSGRDERLLPLEPGHKYFLAAPLAPRAGRPLAMCCGTGNFLSAARDRGYGVTGMELDRKAARFSKERRRLQRCFPVTIYEFFGRKPEG